MPADSQRSLRIAQWALCRAAGIAIVLMARASGMWQRSSPGHRGERLHKDLQRQAQRDELLAREIFYTLLDVRVLTERYRHTYNRVRSTAPWITGRRLRRPSCLPSLPAPCRTNMTSGGSLRARHNHYLAPESEQSLCVIAYPSGGAA